MGTINKGILGGFSGTVGTVVGGNWKGIDYMRSRSNKKAGGSTTAQLAQQARFTLAMRFLQPLNGLLELSFRDYAVKMTGINNAMKYLMANAITGTYPAFSIDYEQVLISRGELPNAGAPAAAATGTTVHFTWTDNSGTGKADATDQALLVAYCPDLKQAEWQLNTAQRVSAGAAMPLAGFAGHAVETWLGFISADGRLIASSVYTGSIVLP